MFYECIMIIEGLLLNDQLAQLGIMCALQLKQ